MKEITFVTGGCRSGKSGYALEAAKKYSGEKKIFIATCVPYDDEMEKRRVFRQFACYPAEVPGAGHP